MSLIKKAFLLLGLSLVNGLRISECSSFLVLGYYLVYSMVKGVKYLVFKELSISLPSGFSSKVSSCK